MCTLELERGSWDTYVVKLLDLLAMHDNHVAVLEIQAEHGSLLELRILRLGAQELGGLLAMAPLGSEEHGSASTVASTGDGRTKGVFAIIVPLEEISKRQG